MINKIINFIQEYNLQDKVIVVGFSGGYDSMCLLDILSKIKEKPEFLRMKIIAAHYNHNWRGEEARTEQEICRLFAQSRDIEFYTETGRVPDKKSENQARIARYEFFENVYDLYDADAIFTAHNKDDNAETVLYRIIKGTGIIGLKGISQKRDYFYRPMLNISRKEVLEYCEKNNLSPNNDSSNSDISYKRNYIRLNILPSLEKINTSVKDSLNTLAQIARNDDSIIEEYLSKFRDSVFDNNKIISKNYAPLSKPVKLRFLYEFIQKFDLDYDSKKINEIYNFIEENIEQKNGTTLSLATAMWLYVDEKIIETIPSQKSKISENIDIIVNSEGEYKVGEKTISIKKYINSNELIFPEAFSHTAFVDLSKIEFPLHIRTRKDGDIINPFGMTGTMKLKKYLNSKGVPRHERDEVILLTDSQEVLWAIGVGISNKIGVETTPTHIIDIK